MTILVPGTRVFLVLGIEVGTRGREVIRTAVPELVDMEPVFPGRQEAAHLSPDRDTSLLLFERDDSPHVTGSTSTDDGNCLVLDFAGDN